MGSSDFTSVGISQGFQSGLDSARYRRLEEQEIKRRRQREDMETEAFEFELDRARKGAEREDEIYARNLDDLERRNQEEGFFDFANALNQGVDPQVAMRQFNKAGSLRLEEVQFDQTGLTIRDSDGEIEHFDNPNQMLAAFGIQPGQAEPIKLGKDDRLVTAGGEEIVGAAEGSQEPGKNLVKVGDALYDSENEKWITPPADAGGSSDRYIEVDKHLYDTANGEWLSPPGGGSGSDDGRGTSPFNPESTLQKIEQGIVRSHGGSWDALGNYSLPGDREIVDIKLGLAGEAFSRLDDYVRDGKISYTQIEQAVIESSKGISTDSELEKKGEAWRVDPVLNRDETEKQDWMQRQRDKEMSEARAKLAAAEQKMIGSGSPSLSAPAKQPPINKPEWAGNEIPAEALGGATLDPSKEYDVQDEQGNRKTIRMGADGKVYEVKGKSETIAPKREPKEPKPDVQPSNRPVDARTFQNHEDEATLASAREDGFNGTTPSSDDAEKTFKRVRIAMSQDKAPRSNDVALLNGLDDAALSRLGLNQEQIASIRALAGTDQTLASLKREPEKDIVY